MHFSVSALSELREPVMPVMHRHHERTTGHFTLVTARQFGVITLCFIEICDCSLRKYAY